MRLALGPLVSLVSLVPQGLTPAYITHNSAQARLQETPVNAASVPGSAEAGDGDSDDPQVYESMCNINTGSCEATPPPEPGKLRSTRVCEASLSSDRPLLPQTFPPSRPRSPRTSRTSMWTRTSTSTTVLEPPPPLRPPGGPCQTSAAPRLPSAL